MAEQMRIVILELALGLKPNEVNQSKLPGPQPHAMHRKHLAHLAEHRTGVFITLKTNGPRHMMVATHSQIFVFDRAFRAFTLKPSPVVDRICKSIQGAKPKVMDGDLALAVNLKTKPPQRALAYVPFDCYLTDATRISSLPYKQRLDYVIEFTRDFMPHSEDLATAGKPLPFIVLAKPIVPLAEFAKIRECTQMMKDKRNILLTSDCWSVLFSLFSCPDMK